MPLTGLRVLCSLKVSSRIADCSFDNRSFFLTVSPVPPASSSELSISFSFSFSSSLVSLSFLFPLMLDIVLFGDDTPTSSQSAIVGARFTSMPLRYALVSAKQTFRSQLLNTKKPHFQKKKTHKHAERKREQNRTRCMKRVAAEGLLLHEEIERPLRQRFGAF